MDKQSRTEVRASSSRGYATLVAIMKLTVAVKLLPSSGQADALRETLRRSNSASNYVSGVAWEERVFGKHSLQRLCYHEVKLRFSLTAQAAIQACRKVADSYRLGKKVKRSYRPFGSIAYDNRILSWKPEASEVSIWMVSEGGAKARQRIPFVCDGRAREMLKSRRGESDLVYRSGNSTCSPLSRLRSRRPEPPRAGSGLTSASSISPPTRTARRTPGGKSRGRASDTSASARGCKRQARNRPSAT